LNEIAFLKTATHILSTVFAHIWSTYAETEAYFGKLIFAFLIHTLLRKKMAKIAFFNLNRHHFENFVYTTTVKGILFDAIYLRFVSGE
jgi:hypothetical protein